MRKECLDKLIDYIVKERVSSPEFKFNGRELHVTSSLFNYGTITSLILLPLIIFLMQKTNLLVGLLLLGAAIFSLWYDFEPVNNFEIDIDSNCAIIKRRSPITRLFFFMNQDVKFSVSDMAGFSYRSTPQNLSFRRYRFYVSLKNGDEFLFSDIESEAKAMEIVFFLNKAFK